jgi:hypothetical protein
MTWDDVPGMALYFCGHHGSVTAMALMASGWTIHPIPALMEVPA